MWERKGFTLIELIVIIFIIGVLATIGLYAAAGIQQRARDGKRKTDLGTIKSGLERYYADNRSYPIYETIADIQPDAYGKLPARFELEKSIRTYKACDRSYPPSNNKKFLAPEYLPTIPEDPIYNLSKNAAWKSLEEEDNAACNIDGNSLNGQPTMLQYMYFSRPVQPQGQTSHTIKPNFYGVFARLEGKPEFVASTDLYNLNLTAANLIGLPFSWCSSTDIEECSSELAYAAFNDFTYAVFTFKND